MRPLLLAIVGLSALSGCAQDNCDPGNICTWYGEPGVAGLTDDGVHRLEANTFWPTDLNFRPTDNQPVILDWNNHKIISLDPKGKVVAISGTGGELGDGPEGPALDATWNHPTDVDWLSDGSMVLAAWHNSRVAVFSPDYSDVSWLAGTGGRDFTGDGSDARDASLDLPCGIRVDDDDNVFIGDMANQRIRMISPEGTIETVAGNGEHGWNGDGAADEVSFASPALQRAEPAFKMDRHNGVFYIADTHNGRIRTFDPASGMVETIAGMGSTPENSDNGTACTEGCGYGGDGGPALDAMLNTPSDVAVASDGTVYIADTDNSCIRVVTPDGIMETFAGTCGSQGYEGENVPAEEALLARPFGVSVDLDDNVYISDTYNNIIRKVVPL